MINASGTGKYNSPLHPIGTHENDTAEWFFDDDQHRGPNTQLAGQDAGIKPKDNTVQCGDCHTPTNSSKLAQSDSGSKEDPHSAHRDVSSREGCIRCHSWENVTFASGETWSFDQGNATRMSYGIANPINMTRAWDGKFLSTVSEAAYNYSAGGSGLDDTGSGWSKYGSADASNTTAYSCGDCHDQYHADGGLGFTFSEALDSRKEPLTKVNDSNSGRYHFR